LLIPCCECVLLAQRSTSTQISVARIQSELHFIPYLGQYRSTQTCDLSNVKIHEVMDSLDYRGAKEWACIANSEINQFMHTYARLPTCVMECIINLDGEEAAFRILN